MKDFPERFASLLATPEMSGTRPSILRSHVGLGSPSPTPHPSQRVRARPQYSLRHTYWSLTPLFPLQISLLPHPNGIFTWSGTEMSLTSSHILMNMFMNNPHGLLHLGSHKESEMKEECSLKTLKLFKNIR